MYEDGDNLGMGIFSILYHGCYATRLLALNIHLWLAAHANPAMT